jgi:hypothetical protein
MSKTERDKEILFYNYDDSSDEDDEVNYKEAVIAPRIKNYHERLREIKLFRQIRIGDEEFLSQLREERDEIEDKIDELKDWRSQNPSFLMEAEGRKTIYEKSQSYPSRKKQAFGKTEFPIVSAFEYDKMLAISLQRNGFLTPERAGKWKDDEEEAAEYHKQNWPIDFINPAYQEAKIFTEENKFSFLRKILRQSNRERSDVELANEIVRFAKNAGADISTQQKREITDMVESRVRRSRADHIESFSHFSLNDPEEAKDPELKEKRNLARKEIAERDEKDDQDEIRSESNRIIEVKIEEAVASKITSIAREFKSQLPRVARKLLSRSRVNPDLKSVDDFYSEERLRYRDLVRRSREIRDDKFEVGQSLVFDVEQDLVSQKKQSVRRDNGIDAKKNFFPHRGTMEEEVFNLGNYRKVLEKLETINLIDRDLAVVIRDVFTKGVEIIDKATIEKEEVRLPLSRVISSEQKQILIDVVELLFGTEGFRSPAAITETNMLLDLIIHDPENWNFRKAFIGKYAINEPQEEENQLKKAKSATLERKEKKAKKLWEELSDENGDEKEEVDIESFFDPLTKKVKDNFGDAFTSENQIVVINIEDEKKYFSGKLSRVNLDTLKAMSDEDKAEKLKIEQEKKQKEQKIQEDRQKKTDSLAPNFVLAKPAGMEEIDISEYAEDDFNAQTQIISVSIDGLKKYFNGNASKENIRKLKELSDLENGGALSYSMKSTAGSGGIACGRHLSQIFDEVVQGGEVEDFTNKKVLPAKSTKVSSVDSLAPNTNLRSHKYGGSFVVKPKDFEEYSKRKAEIAKSWKEKIAPDVVDLKEAIEGASKGWNLGS